MSVIIDEFEIVPPGKAESGDTPQPGPQKAGGDITFGAAETARLIEQRAARAARICAH